MIDMLGTDLNKKGKKKSSKNPTELERVFESLSSKVKLAQPAFNAQQHKDETRATIALYFVKGFFVMIGICLVGIPLYNLGANRAGIELLPLKDILPAISGLISGPLGFVVGHYFKSDR
jgi:hypothetical protein